MLFRHDPDEASPCRINHELSFWAATDVGRKREHNEDNFLIDKKLSLFAVADGMAAMLQARLPRRLR